MVIANQYEQIDTLPKGLSLKEKTYFVFKICCSCTNLLGILYIHGRTFCYSLNPLCHSFFEDEDTKKRLLNFR